MKSIENFFQDRNLNYGWVMVVVLAVVVAGIGSGGGCCGDGCCGDSC